MYTFDGHVRQAWGMASPNYSGAVAAAMVVALVGILILGDDLRRSVKLCISCAIAALIIMGCLTYSRGAAVSAIAGLALIVVVATVYSPTRIHRRRAWKITASVVLFALISALCLGFTTRVRPDFIEQDKSVSNRLSVWAGACRALADGPLFGWGFGQSGHVYEDLYQPLSDHTRYLSPVNGYLTAGVEFGPPALVLLLIFSAYLPVRSILPPRRQPDRNNIASFVLAPVILSLAIANIFSTLGLGMLLPALYIAAAAVTAQSILGDLRQHYYSCLAITTTACVAIVLLAVLLPRMVLNKPTFSISAPQGYAGPLTLERVAHQNGAEAAFRRAFLLLDPQVGSTWLVRDARRFLRLHPDYSSCTLFLHHTAFGPRLDAADMVFAIGDWTEVVCRDARSISVPISLIYPVLSPTELGLPSENADALHLAEIITAPFDQNGVGPSWREFATQHSIPMRTADYRAAQAL